MEKHEHLNGKIKGEENKKKKGKSKKSKKGKDKKAKEVTDDYSVVSIRDEKTLEGLLNVCRIVVLCNRKLKIQVNIPEEPRKEENEEYDINRLQFIDNFLSSFE